MNFQKISENLNLNDLPELKLLDKEKLPTVPGIYFAIDDKNQVWYVGKAQNINRRWINHHRYYQLEKINKKNPITLKWYECENNEELLTQLENKFIEYLFPALNQTKVESKEITPSEIALRKTLAKISKYLVIYGFEENSKIFGLPTVFLKYDILHRNPVRILRQIFDADNRKGNLKWSYHRRVKTTPIWKTKCNGIAIVVSGDYNVNFYIQTGIKTTLAEVLLLTISDENYNKNVFSKDWSQSYHPNLKKYVKDPIPLLWSKKLSFDLLDIETIKNLNQQRTESKLARGESRGRQVKVYCEAIGRGKFVIATYEKAIEWFGGYEILGLQKADYLQTKIDAAPRWFKAHKVKIRILEGDRYKSISAPINASNNIELEERLKSIRNISSVHGKIKFKRQ